MNKETYKLIGKHIKNLRKSQLELSKIPCKNQKEANIRMKMQRDYIRIVDVLDCASLAVSDDLGRHIFVDTQ